MTEVASEQKIIESIKPLIARLIHNFLSGTYEQRRESAIALSKFKGEKATDFLLQTYESDNIQDFLALALGNIESEKAVTLLVNALNDPQHEVRFNAAQALGMLEHPAALDILLETLHNYMETTVDSSVADPGQVFFEEDSIISAVMALGKIKNWRAIAVLKKLYEQEKSSRIRASAIQALGMLGSDKLLPVFQQALKDEDPRVRANAIEAIEEMKSASIVGIIQPYLDDPNNRVKANVAKAIWKYGDFDVSSTISQMLKHENKWYKASAAYVIGELKDPRFISSLANTIKDEDPDVRRNSIFAFRKIEYKKALPYLQPLLLDPNFDVRVEAVLALSKCVPEVAGEILAEKLKTEENQVVQATIISSLGTLGYKESAPQIKTYLDSNDTRVVANAIDALSLLLPQPDSELFSRYKQLLKHPDNRVKSNAIKALWKCGKYDVLENLRELFKSKNQKELTSATFILGEIGAEISKHQDIEEQINQIVTELVENRDSLNCIIAKEENLEYVPPQKPEETQPQEEIEKNEPEEEPAEEPAPLIKVQPEVLLDLSFNNDLEKANELIQSGDYAEAHTIYDRILSVNPNHLKALSAQANLYYAEKNYQKASELYLKALAIKPDLVKALFNLGNIYYYSKHYDLAAKYLLKALEIYPKILGAYMILAQIYQIAGRYKSSITLLTKATQLSPRNPIIYQKLASLHLLYGQYDEARDVLQKAISISPMDIESKLLLAYTFNLAGQHKQGFMAYEECLKTCVESSDPDAALKLMAKGFKYIQQLLQEQKPGV